MTSSRVPIARPIMLSLGTLIALPTCSFAGGTTSLPRDDQRIVISQNAQKPDQPSSDKTSPHDGHPGAIVDPGTDIDPPPPPPGVAPGNPKSDATTASPDAPFAIRPAGPPTPR